ncbi:MAG: Oligopeptide ABC transporter, periplasmic oligopeptide-binding protein OppA [uncultured Solirubrobacteraceae bacterium]|uniref:Oligopeptide ABC transporter, periplasmic oligopeptide-binding protein OppA n=1 Tax=uncultured Solirubrobacteraceae bacterium TaxID=1162706 RepID=A0A6J4SWQ6_9ACTN|nr:MAG: Oligopeptide ABC transporter, periplasmic oligopeptide-binding protein OppA [uncultured Solirubrobacteraceae bacterium]
MPRSPLRALLASAVLAATLGLAACGGDEGEQAQTPGSDPAASGSGDGNVTEELFAGTAADNRQNPDEGKRGGKLTMISNGDVDYIDPGQTYYTYAFGILNALHRPLYSYLPGNSEKPVPDLAAGDPEISEDGKTVTVELREGVRFSKPVDREVTSADVKYAVERAYTANVAGPYVGAYFGDVIGAPKKPGDYREVRGIQTPDDQTLVFKLSKGTGAALAGALAMPISIPVPKEYAMKFDRRNPSEYGNNQVFTGPYKIKNNADGRLVGYQPGKRIEIVRNPEYAGVDDFRPAFADEWDIRAGNADTAVAARRILSGESMVTGDIRPPASQLRRLLQDNKESLSAVSGGGWRMISMDTSRPPFDDINVRRAVIAGFDRNAARQQRGGEALGPMAQHFISPGLPGFDESGGFNAPEEFDWMQKPEGDRELAAEYFRKAGFESGKFEGSETVLLVADNADPDKSVAQIAEQQLREMGFKTKLRLVTRDTMFTKFCNVPKSEVHVCPSVGWALDFSDPQTLLDPTFNGANIIPTGNSNWPELDVPEINRQIEDAKLVTDTAERAQAWADVNKAIVAQAPSIPYMWDYQTVLASPNVRGVQNDYTTTWDLNFTSLK